MLQQAESEVPEGEVQPVPEAKGSCFLDQERVCGSDCMAYLVSPPTDPSYIGQQWARCHLLVNIERGGKHLVVLAAQASKMVISKRQDERDKKAPGVL